MPVSVPVGAGALEHVEVRRGEYHDSVTLMLAARAVAGVAGVERVLVAMATDLNIALLADLGYPPPAPDVGPADLIIAFSRVPDGSEGPESLEGSEAPLTALAEALTPAPPASGGAITAPGHPHPAEPLPRTTAAALGRTGAPVTLISTPGLAAVPEAVEALEYGASPVIFSDNIPIHHEVRLKEEAGRRGLLVMGPDCGTVVLHGTGLGFANITRRGPVSLVAASGTGAQELMALLDAADTGIRHCLGVGGRDLTEQVAGRSTLAALTALADDDETELIAVVSKPPHPAIAARIEAHAAGLGKPVHFAFVGPEHPTLTESAERILAALGRRTPRPWPQWEPTNPAGLSGPAVGQAPHRAPAIRGLFSGGTLRAEAEAVLGRARALMTDNEKSGGRGEGESREPRRHTAPATTAAATPDPAAGAPFTYDLTDFGDDAYTRGRPHPMIDNTLRLRALSEAAADAGVGVLLLDVVLGRGAHNDPGAELAAAIADVVERRPEVAVVVSLCGTARDPQGLGRQAEVLAGAGARVFLSNAEAAEAAVRSALGGPAGTDR